MRHTDGSVVREGADTIGITLTLSAGHRLHYRSGRLMSDGYPPVGSITIQAPGEPARLSLSGRIQAIRLELPVCAMASWVEDDLGVDGTRIALRNTLDADDPVLRRLLFDAMVCGGEDVGRAIAVHLLGSYGVGGSSVRASGGIAPARLGRILDMVEQSPPEEINLRGLAARAGMSPFHFSRAFRATVGEPPMRYVAGRLALRSLRHLAESDATVATIARRTGFVDASHLSRHLSRVIGMTPGQYRTLARSC